MYCRVIFSMFFFVIHCQTQIANLSAYYERKSLYRRFFWKQIHDSRDTLRSSGCRSYPPLFDENEPIPDQVVPGLERVGENPENRVGSRPSVD